MADVCVIIPCYNARAWIAQTLDSVLAQTDRPRTVLVVDDGSTDDSAAVVEHYVRQASAGGVVRLIRQENAGESRARNVGIEQAVEPLIAFLDADDLWLPDKTARQLETLARFPETVATHSRCFDFQSDLDDRGRAENERTKDSPSIEDLIRYHYVTPSTLLVRADVLRRRGIRFEEAIRHSEDMLFAADLALAGPLRLTDGPLVGKRVHARQQSRHHWHAIYSLESRTQWCLQRRTQLGPQRAQALLDHLGYEMVTNLEDHYWHRHLDGFADARQRVGRLYPELLAASQVANRRIYPRWVYRLRDVLAGART